MDDENYPILPIHTNESLSARKDIIRNYVTLSYRQLLSYIHAV